VILFDEWELTPQRVAIHRPSAVAVIADVHLGYNQARRKRGEAVPLVAVADQLAPLHRLLQPRSITRLAVAGDLFAAEPDAALVEEFVAWLQRAGVELIGIAPGNHDGPLEIYGSSLPIYEEGVPLDGWLVMHGHEERPSGQVVQGHVHPWLRLGSQIDVPCYLAAEQRLVLPALSQDAAGVNVLTESDWESYRCLVCAGRKVLDLGPVGRLRGR
jgi:metallophosphoesterase superfamily enzyme